MKERQETRNLGVGQRRLRAAGRRRGTIYLVVLALVMLVTAIGLSAMLAIRVQRLASNSLNDADAARLYAWSGIDLGRLWINQDANWRKDRSSGVWVTKQTIGGGSFSLSVVDPVDGNFTNDANASVILTATGYQGAAVQMVSVQLDAQATPMDILANALTAAGTVNIGSGDQLLANNAIVATSGTLANSGTVGANVQCLLALPQGNVTGTVTILSILRTFPGTAPITTYTSLGTSVTPPSTIEKVVMAPGINPYGTGDPNGIYILHPSGNLTIRDCRIYGTLVIVCPGNTVTFQRNVFIQPVSGDYASIIINGNAVMTYDSAGSTVSESSLGVNLNPAGAPYNGQTNATATDSYPCEIRGLVHVTGTLSMSSTALVRGAVICEGAPLLANGVDVEGNNEIVYDPTLYTHPPVGYQKSTQMVVDPGNRKQAVN